MKKFLILIVLIIIGIIAYTFTHKDEVEMVEQMPVENTGSDKEATGEVVAIDNSQIAFDGPTLITLQTTTRTQETIAIPSMGINLCVAKPNMIDVATIKAGDQIEVKGYAEDGQPIVPCESTDHYLRLVTR